MAFPIRPRPAGDAATQPVTQPDPPSAWIRLVGGVDLATVPALREYAERLHGLTLRFIVIDLTAVTYVGSTFVNFLAALHGAHPGSELVLHKPSALARMVLAATGMDGHVVMSGHPASSGVAPGSADAAVTIVQLNAGCAPVR